MEDLASKTNPCSMNGLNEYTFNTVCNNPEVPDGQKILRSFFKWLILVWLGFGVNYDTLRFICNFSRL